MLKRMFIASVLALNACSLLAKPDQNTEEILQTHQVVLQAIVDYVQQLQTQGLLPKPEELERIKTK